MSMDAHDRAVLENIKRDVEVHGEAAVVAKYRCGVYSAPHDVYIMVCWVRQAARDIRARNRMKVRVYSHICRVLEL